MCSLYTYLYIYIVASFASGFVVATAMNPFDVVSTRLYSQQVVNGKGTLYDGLLDCFLKIGKSEGFGAFYKGWTAHYLRVGPHTIFTFVLWEQLKQQLSRRGL